MPDKDKGSSQQKPAEKPKPARPSQDQPRPSKVTKGNDGKPGKETR